MTLPRKGKDARNEISYGLTLAGCIPRGMGKTRGAGVINNARNKHSPLEEKAKRVGQDCGSLWNPLNGFLEIKEG